MGKSTSHDRDDKTGKVSLGRGSTQDYAVVKENQLGRAGKAVVKGIGKGIVRAVAGPKRK